MLEWFSELRFERLNLILALITMFAFIPLMFILRRKQRPARIRFSSLHNVKKSPPSFKVRWRNFPFYLRVIALLCFLIAFAHPYLEREKDKNKKAPPAEKKPEKKEETKKIKIPTEGISIQLVIDRSGSMGSFEGRWGKRINYMEFEGDILTKLKVVKILSKRFIEGTRETNKEKNFFSGRANDMIGLYTFARYPFVACPLTLRHKLLIDYISKLETVKEQEEDGTYIGYALQRAILHIVDTRSRAQEQQRYHIKSSIIVLITDGMQQLREEDEESKDKSLLPSEAAQLASNNGIKIYCIAIAPRKIYDEDGTLIAVPPTFSIDELQKTAQISGGKFYLARDGQAMKNIYQEIDQLEKTKLSAEKEMEAKIEKTAKSKKKEMEKIELFPAFLWTGFIVFILELSLTATIFRRIP